jgi:hypothetical protein
MTSPSSDSLPPDAEGLARVAGDESAPSEVRRRAFDALLPIITRVVHRLAVRFSGQVREDFLSDAPGDAWQALPRFPQGARFEPWCLVVLRNRVTDRVRHEQTERRHADAAGRQRPEAAELASVLEEACDRHDRLSPQDLAIVGGWPLRHRLALLCISGLWTKVPPGDWQQWVDEHRRAFGVPDDGPFPQAALQACDEIPRRNDLVAGALNIRRNTLSVWLHRGQARLLELRCVRDRLSSV